MSLLFADIYEGIRAVRIAKGVSEKDILNYVQEKVGGCMNVGNVLKTIRTLKKLCEEGVLVKKGKRYMFSLKRQAEEEEECEDEEDEDMEKEDDECEEPQKGVDDKEEEEEDDDDDYDEEDEEDDDDDDDDDDECNEKEATQEDVAGIDAQCDSTRSPIRSKESYPRNSNGSPTSTGGNNNSNNNNNNNSNNAKGNSNSSNNNNNNNNGNCIERKVNRNYDLDNPRKSGSERSGRKSCKDKSVIQEECDEGVRKGKESVAFCVRDFMDSQDSPHDSKEEPGKEEEILQEQMDATKTFDFGKGFSTKKRNFRGKRKPVPRSCHRSRSPLKDVENDMYHCLGQGKSDDAGLGAVSSEFFQGPTDTEMEVDLEKEDFDGVVRHRPQVNITSPDAVGLDGPESRSDDWGKKPCAGNAKGAADDANAGLAKRGSETSQVGNADCEATRMNWFPLEEVEKGQGAPKRSRSYEEEEGNSHEKSVSLCSVCEKKKRST